jgi:gluconokinase
MSRGIPLTDQDRAPWLSALEVLIAERLATRQPAIIASSALKDAYRVQLGAQNPQVALVYLQGDYDLISSRMRRREGHFFKPRMLQSQFDTLEVPQDAVIVAIDQPTNQIVEEILNALKLQPAG